MPSSPSQGSTSTPNGAGGVAPGQQSPGSQLTPSGSSTGSLVTTSDESQTFGPTHPSEGNGRSITSTGTGSSPLSSSGGISPLNTPGQPTPSSPDQGGGVGPHPASSSPQTSYTFAPGVVPYGATSPSMTTLASMLAWREPDGERGSPAMLRPAGMYDHPNLQQDVPVLNFEEAPTTATTFSKSADPRWQRIRPVYVW
ncbi:hypothetical protein GGS21DRAFT_508755 [Xylaria nigripes]|nr:hypothetical protein GGS21DRAFT_508755 [Xylaria nigripes]